ncbi:hypothetical protein L596_029385 [Steinernema carpocapsae]|uniref:Uncharacterized protein n=1 Tax=Steinernema carpocapsae TaxID=34508 RepID=A0A4U5LUH6_STECR|nr:hypothetical protein L596_029385 [Steinernema carpocapsae]
MSWTLLEEASYSCLQILGFLGDRFPEINRRMLLMSLDFGLFRGFSSWLIGSARVIDGDVMVKRLSIHVMSSSSLIDGSFVDSGAGIVELSWAFFEQASYSCLQILGFLGDGFPEINSRMLLMSLDFGLFRGFSSWLIGSARVIDGDVMVKRLSIDVMSSSSLIDGSFVDSGAGIVKMSWNSS